MSRIANIGYGTVYVGYTKPVPYHKIKKVTPVTKQYPAKQNKDKQHKVDILA